MKALLSLLAALLVASTGWSFTYIYPNSDPTLLPVKWPPGTVSLTIMLGTDRTSDGSTFNASGQAAAQTWNNVIGDLQFQVQTAAAGPASNGNGVNELAFGTTYFGKAFGTGVLAITTTLVNTHTGARVEADTVFNNKDFTWDSYRGPLHSGSGAAIDLQRVAIHELGHNLGLDHPDDAGQTVTAIMNSHVSNVDTLATDDITGVQNLYGPATPLVPANDNFANATTLTLNSSNSASVSGYNTNATKEANEPNHAGNVGGRSVWWKWTAPSGGSITVDTKGSYFDTTLAVYTGSTVGSLNEVASNDDISSGVVQASTVTFNVTAGTTYFIAVDGFNDIARGDTSGGDSAGYTLNLNFTPTPGTPAITTQPASQIVTAGANVSFSVTATGASPLAYQWYFGTAAISGATNATLSLPSVLTASAGSYYVTVGNALGSVTSSTATLTVNVPAPPTPVPTTPAPSSGGGGGGAPSVWFMAVLSALGIGRLLRNRR